MQNAAFKETLKIRDVQDLYLAVAYFHDAHGLEKTKLTFPDGLPLVSLTYVRRNQESGAETSELVFSEQWPEGAVRSTGYECFRMPEDEER